MSRATPGFSGLAALALWGGLGCGQAEHTAKVITGGTFNCVQSTEGRVWCEDYERAEGREIANQMDNPEDLQEGACWGLRSMRDDHFQQGALLGKSKQRHRYRRAKRHIRRSVR